MAHPNDAPALVWFRDDLRIADNPALSAAAADGRPIACLYVLEEAGDGVKPHGGAGRWWLHHSLASLTASLERRGIRLILKRGSAAKIVPRIARDLGAGLVVWNRRYGPAAEADAKTMEALRRSKIEVRTFKANVLYEPADVSSRSGQPFRVFSAFWRAAGQSGEPRAPIPAPDRLVAAAAAVDSDALDSFDLQPVAPDWSEGMQATWTPGEAGAAARLAAFADGAIDDYARARDLPGTAGTSMLSPHLRFGEVSPFQAWQAAAASAASTATGKFKAELGWREFAYHVLGQFPELGTRNLRPEFDRFPWQEAYADEMWAWRRGQTGYPIVDAGMRQLWQTGWMHNRVRMIVASFLTKHLLADWQIGEEWFWDTLVDADPASNPFNWQWVAGSGADAAALLPHLQPGAPGREVRSRRRLCEAAMCRSSSGFPPPMSTRPGPRPRALMPRPASASARTTPCRSSTMQRRRARALEAFAQIGVKGRKPSLDRRCWATNSFRLPRVPAQSGS